MSLAAIIGLCLFLIPQTIAVPWVKREMRYSDEIGVGPFMVWRGGLILVFGGGYITYTFGHGHLPSYYELGIALFSGLAVLSFYKALQYWPGSVVMIVLCMTPIVNFLFALHRGESVSLAAILATACLIIGSAIALFGGEIKRSEKNFSLTRGATWSVIALFTNALLYEILSLLLNKIQDKNMILEQQARAFLLIGVGIIVCGLLFTRLEEFKKSLERGPSFFAYGIAVGMLYFIGFALIFQSLPLEWASPLTMLELPMLMLGFRLVVGKSEQLTVLQYIGVTVAMIPPIVIKLTV